MDLIEFAPRLPDVGNMTFESNEIALAGIDVVVVVVVLFALVGEVGSSGVESCSNDFNLSCTSDDRSLN